MFLKVLIDSMSVYAGAYLFLFFIAIALIKKASVMVNQGEVVIVERLGKFHSVLHPGLHFLVPFVDAIRVFEWTFTDSDGYSKRSYRKLVSLDRIDIREGIYDFPRQNVITKDNVTMAISAILYWQITDPKRAVYEVQNLPESISQLAQTKLREVIGSLDLDETLCSRDCINEKLRETLDSATDKWGVKVNRVELQEIIPPEDIKIAMEKQMRAERDRRAIILEAEGEKSAAILRAEAEKTSAILKAEGEKLSKIEAANGAAAAQEITSQAEAKARIIGAKAEAEALEAVSAVLKKDDPAKYMLAQNYIKALSKMTEGNNTKTVVLPYDTTAVLGSIAGIKELFNSDKKS